MAMTGGISLICDTKTTFLVWRALVIAFVSEIVVHEVYQSVYAIRGMSDLGNARMRFLRGPGCSFVISKIF